MSSDQTTGSKKEGTAEVNRQMDQKKDGCGSGACGGCSNQSRSPSPISPGNMAYSGPRRPVGPTPVGPPKSKVKMRVSYPKKRGTRDAGCRHKERREAIHDPTGRVIGYLTSSSSSCCSESPEDTKRGQAKCPFRKIGVCGKKVLSSGSGQLLLALGVAAAAYFIYRRVTRSN